MEIKKAEIVQRLVRENGRFRRLYEQHKQLEQKLKKYNSRPYLNPKEHFEKIRLKKLKLKGKDVLERIISGNEKLEVKNKK